ncbi:diguanylate cyclase (plasmid) [Catenovulum sp. SX2]|uniref:diguanylate cyclase n=1 Tax=Catenovulum sp. SX2 TaxID=3398614 RepID=UPI003F864743
MKCLTVLLGLVYATFVNANPNLVIKHNKIDSPKEEYQFGLLKLALSYSDKKYQFDESNTYLTQQKLMSDLGSNNISVAWVGTSSEYEQTYQPIRVPLFKGLLGYRIFLIKPEAQESFNQINSAKDLSGLRAGQVRTWVDTQILQQANLPVVTSNKFSNLFYMLEGQRFDYFPRSVYSAYAEKQKYPELGLQVENSLILVYTLPGYFFVNKQNQALYQEISAGLNAAIDDGSFDQYMLNHPLIKDALELSNIQNRKVIRLDNPFLPPQTPINDKRLWFNLAQH